MKEKTGLVRHVVLSKNFIMMLAALVAILVSVSAWFTSRSSATASGIAVVAENPGIDIAPCIKVYNEPGKTGYDRTKEDFAVLSDGPGEFGTGFSILDTNPGVNLSLTKDCTGDGVNLWVPDFNVTKDYDNVRRNGGKEVNVNIAGTSAKLQEDTRIEHLKDPSKDEDEHQFIELEFYARTQNDSLHLAAGSQLLSVTEAGGGDLSDTLSSGNAKCSAYGSFNVDGLVGAIRVALLGEACNSIDQRWSQDSGTTGSIIYTDAPVADRSGKIKQVLWYPRPDVKLNIPETAGDVTNWSLITGLTEGDTFNNSYYEANGSGMRFVSNDQDSKTKVSSAAPTLGQTADISDFGEFEHNKVRLVVNKNQYQETAMYYLYKYTLRIWIEGSDSEARRAMDGGQFQLTLKLE